MRSCVGGTGMGAIPFFFGLLMVIFSILVVRIVFAFRAFQRRESVYKILLSEKKEWGLNVSVIADRLHTSPRQVVRALSRLISQNRVMHLKENNTFTTADILSRLHAHAMYTSVVSDEFYADAKEVFAQVDAYEAEKKEKAK